MKKRLLHIISSLLMAVFFFSCDKKEEIEVEVPVSAVKLMQPENGDSIDLNHAGVNEYVFSWNNDTLSDHTLVLSLNKYLLDPVYIQVGPVQSYTLSLQQIDEYFADFGIAGGETQTVYWSVKPSGQLDIASKEIFYFLATRIRTKLLKPEDMSVHQLLWPETETPLQFVWDNEGIEQGTQLEICFSNNPTFTDKIVSAEIHREGILTHSQLQEIVEKFMSKKYTTTRLYWNIKNKSTGEYISRAPSALNLKDMMFFKDVRGTESIRYKVTRITYTNGTSYVWLAENLRAKHYPDGTPIESTNVYEASVTPVITEGHVKAYGCYYTYWIQDKIAPKGWRLPTFDEWQALFDNARMEGGSFAVIKDPVYYENFDGKDTPQANAWGLGLVSAGNYNTDNGELNNAMAQYCYYYASDLLPDYHNFVHDGGWTLWKTWGTPSPARFIYIED